MPSEKSNAPGNILNELKQNGLLLASDRLLPSVAGVVAGEPVRGSWWGHARAHEIFRALTNLSEDSDVLVTKLVSCKVTFVHRQLWPALLGVARGRSPWQMKSLSATARSLLKLITSEGQIQTDQLPEIFRVNAARVSAAARELEEKLLVHSEEIHTRSGAHAKRLESWRHWSTRVKFHQKLMPPTQARNTIEQRMEQLNKQFGAAGRLPWCES